MGELVWLPGYQRHAILVQHNAYFSVVAWEEDGQSFELEVENDEYELLGNDND